MKSDLDTTTTTGWRLPRGELSLREVHGSIPVPQDAGFWRKMFAFAGPGYLVAVGYMDPGNWATDLQGGANYKYGLLWVVAQVFFPTQAQGSLLTVKDAGGK